MGGLALLVICFILGKLAVERVLKIPDGLYRCPHCQNLRKVGGVWVDVCKGHPEL
jgi:hypothetical protein